MVVIAFRNHTYRGRDGRISAAHVTMRVGVDQRGGVFSGNVFVVLAGGPNAVKLELAGFFSTEYAYRSNQEISAPSRESLVTALSW